MPVEFGYEGMAVLVTYLPDLLKAISQRQQFKNFAHPAFHALDDLLDENLAVQIFRERDTEGLYWAACPVRAVGGRFFSSSVTMRRF